MKRVDTDYDPLDRHLSRVLGGWASSVPLPRDARSLLMQRARLGNSVIPAGRRSRLRPLLQWALYTLILSPVDMALQPVLYLPAGEVGPAGRRPQVAPLSERFLSHDTVSLGVGLFSFVF